LFSFAYKKYKLFFQQHRRKKMTNMMFSSAEYIRELRTSGLSQEQSETISRGVENIRDDMNQLATKEGLQEVKDDLREIKKDVREVKDDIKELDNKTHSLRKDLNEGINGLRTELNDGLNGLRTELNDGLNGLRTELNDGLNGLRTELRHEVTELRGEIRDLRNDIKKDFIDFRTEIKEDFKMFVHLLDNKILDIEKKVLNRWVAQSSALIMMATTLIIATIAFVHR
jgi:uncharacterized phage infection (PIP) family protein YhgE